MIYVDRGKSPFSHKTIIHLFYPSLFCITIVSIFASVLQSSQKKSNTIVMQFFLGRGGGGVGGKQSAVWKMVNLVLSICKSSKVRSLRTSHEPLQRTFFFLELNFSSEASTLRMRPPHHLGSGGHVLVNTATRLNL